MWSKRRLWAPRKAFSLRRCVRSGRRSRSGDRLRHGHRRHQDRVLPHRGALDHRVQRRRLRQAGELGQVSAAQGQPIQLPIWLARSVARKMRLLRCKSEQEWCWSLCCCRWSRWRAFGRTLFPPCLTTTSMVSAQTRCSARGFCVVANPESVCSSLCFDENWGR